MPVPGEALQVVDPALQIVARAALQLQLVAGAEVGDAGEVVGPEERAEPSS
jgi:hypothetical protein